MLRNGLYEQVINKALEGELATTDKLVETAPIGRLTVENLPKCFPNT